MAEHDARRIAHEATSEPHVRGRRISVRQVDALVKAGGVDRETVADRDDLDVAGVYHALAHYHDHPREMSTVETERADTFESIRESIDRPDVVDPDAVRDGRAGVSPRGERRPEDGLVSGQGRRPR